MQKAFLVVIAFGAVIGLLWPSAKAPSSVGAAASSSSQVRETVLERSENGHFYAHVEVNGELVRFMIDTGATTVAITEKDAARVGLKFSPDDYEEVGMGAGGPIRGKLVTLDKVVMDGKEARGVEGTILQGGGMNLLGQEFLARFSVEMRGDTMRIY
jgi:aspartyl protease family protein